jgi:tetratricopeptide (TPR) repeat protein
MAFSKIKTLETAQKYASQGKLAQAIAQYQEILRRDAHDQTTLMTLGDLYVQAGEIPRAVEQFERLGELFLTDGFTSKAIAIYKKIAKLQPSGTAPLERLADLYAQQGVLSEARPLYLQVAETQIRLRRTDAAVSTLRKLLEVEPENLRVQTRLADLYVSLGRTRDAAAAYLVGAQRMFDHGNAEEAERLAARALEVDPGNSVAIALRGRALAGAGRAAEAVALLESLPEPPPEIGPLLIELYIAVGQLPRAAERARQALAAHPEQAPLALDVVQALLETGAAEEALALLGELRGPLSGAGEYDRLARALGVLADRLPGRLEPLEWLAEAGRRSGDTLRLTGALGRLGDALVAAGELERAAKAFEEWYERSGGDEAVRRKLNAVREQLGLEPVSEPPAGSHSSFAQPAQGAPVAPASAAGEPAMDAETRQFLTQALTDVDLYSSYGMAPKAFVLLESVLERVPGHAPALEKMLDLAVALGDDQRTVSVAFELQQIYGARGDRVRAEHYSELCRRYRRVTGIAPPAVAEPEPQPEPPQEFVIPQAEPEAEDAEPAPLEPQAAPEPEGEAAVYEVDLSAEWAALAKETVEPEEAPAEVSAEEAADEAQIEAAAEYDLEPLAADPGQASPADAMTSSEFLAELGAEVEEFTEAASSGAPEEVPAETVPVARAEAPTAPAAPGADDAGQSVSQLSEVFEEFRSELGGLSDEDEDLEKHYNLGIAYREMGLLEESISEFQRVAKAVQQGRPFRYAMQCCTLLGLSFFDKGQPKAAAMWYRRALETPGLDPESVMALRYDLAVALEAAGEAGEALESFLQVYAMNIDYRDVAERIAALERRPAGPAAQ